jgi:hypothetical protein
MLPQLRLASDRNWFEIMTISALSAWKEGVSLWGAVEKYSNEHLWNESITISEELSPKIQEYQPNEPIKWEAAPPLEEDPVKRYQILTNRLSRIDDQLKSEIIMLLSTGNLLAVGYVPPRLRGRDPIWIDRDCWDRGKVDWAQSQLWGDRNRIEEVRVVRPPAATAAEAIASISPTIPPRSPGRPSRAEEIKLAYSALREERKIDFTRSLRGNLTIIQQAVHKLSEGPPDLKGLGYEAVRLAVGQQFRQDQARWQGSC